MQISDIFAVSFSAVSAVSLFLGIYILYLNSKMPSNRLFAALTFAITVWSFGFAVAISARDLETCLFWRRFSAFGWGTFFSIMLHFFLVYTSKTKLLEKFWIYILLYLPSLVTILGFGYFPGLNPDQYRLEKTVFGWTNVAANNGWDLFHSIYYMSFFTVGFLVMWLEVRREKDKNIKKQTRLILYSFLVTMVAGSLTDILFGSLTGISFPQIAPIFMLFPIIVVYHSIKKYGLLNPRYAVQETVLMNGQIRKKMINYLSNAFIGGGLLGIIAQYIFIKESDWLSALTLGLIFLLAGILLQVIQRIRIGNAIKDVLIAILISALIPLVTLKYVEYGSITVWAFPFVFLIISIIFSGAAIRIALLISMIGTQISVWIINPQTVATVDGSDYIIRIGLCALAVWFTFFINKIFISKLNENSDQIRMQRFISEMSTEFISVNAENFGRKAEKIQSRLRSYMGADLKGFYLFDKGQNRSVSVLANEDRMIHEDLDIARYPWLAERLAKEHMVYLSEAGNAGEITAAEQGVLAELGITAAVAIKDNDTVLGFIGINSDTALMKWDENQQSCCWIVSNILADALVKVRQEREINYMAYYDHLTGLPNRNLFRDRVNQAIHLAARSSKLIAVIYVDLDAFKSVNDTLGHDGGDGLLIEVAQKLSTAVRKSDTVSRFGGDEFLVMLNQIGSTGDVTQIAEKIMKLFRQPFMLNEQEFFVTASAGVAVFPGDGGDADLLIRNAEVAMYKAKENGKNQVQLCTADMKDEIIQRMRLSNFLHRALERSELEVYYQPQIDAGTGSIIGLEALLRWNHPEMGMISPGVFIPLAEQTGLINPIGEWVLRTACRQLALWCEAGLPQLRMAVNVSLSQFRNPKLAASVNSILKETGVEPGCLELEITESIAMNESESVVTVLSGLKKLGVSISIDDFGTEYSSLSRLTLLPIDRLKMDIRFVRGITEGDRERAVAVGIINLAHNLGLKVIAEGVENTEQLEFLQTNRCDEVQGFYFYRPAPAGETERILKEII